MLIIMANKITTTIIIGIFILLSRESDQCAIRARSGVAGHLSTTLRWRNSVKPFPTAQQVNLPAFSTLPLYVERQAGKL